MTYEAAKFIHIIGVVILVGNVTATAIWKLFADRTGNPGIIAFAQRLVTVTDWSLTFWGAILTIGGGYAAAFIGQFNLFSDRWLVMGQGLFLFSGALWLGMLVPLQLRMARMALRFGNDAPIPRGYILAGRTWFVLGVASTVPLIGATWVMIAKPL